MNGRSEQVADKDACCLFCAHYTLIYAVDYVKKILYTITAKINAHKQMIGIA